jgi:hypothetical protein
MTPDGPGGLSVTDNFNFDRLFQLGPVPQVTGNSICFTLGTDLARCSNTISTRLEELMMFTSSLIPIRTSHPFLA